MSCLRIGNSAETEHFPEKNTKGPDVTFVVHLGKKECKYPAKCIERTCHVTHLPIHQNLGRHPPNRKTSRGVVQLFNGGVQRVGEAEVGHFCNCAFLSEQDVPEKRWNIFLQFGCSLSHLAARSPCTILCCSRNSIPRLTCSQVSISTLFIFVHLKDMAIVLAAHLLTSNKHQQEFFCRCPFEKTLT